MYIVERDGDNWAVIHGVTGDFIADFETRNEAYAYAQKLNRIS